MIGAMKAYHTLVACAALLAASPLAAQRSEYVTPGDVIAKAAAEEWVAIAPADLMVMDLAPDARGKPRRVVIQLMPAPLSQGWVGNIRKLVAARWYDGISVNRVQDNYVVQWGDASEKKALPDGLETVGEECYVLAYGLPCPFDASVDADKVMSSEADIPSAGDNPPVFAPVQPPKPWLDYGDAYRATIDFKQGWPMAFGFGKAARPENWPVHCYGMVGVGRNLSPDTGTGAELYTVIGHAPRHLDRNIALVGRVIKGIEHLSSLPRGTGTLGFYENADERVPILSVRMGDEVTDLPAFQYLSTESTSFAAYADARANRRDDFFIVPAGGADICNIPVPIRVAP